MVPPSPSVAMRCCGWMRPQRPRPAPGCSPQPMRPAKQKATPALPTRWGKARAGQPNRVHAFVEGGRRCAGTHALKALGRTAEEGAGEGGGGWVAPWRASKYDAEIWAISVPILFALLTVPLSTAVDAAIVGRLGTAQLGGVGLASAFVNTLSSVFVFLQILVTPAVAKTAAQNNAEELSTTIANALWVAAIVGMLISIFSFVGAEAIVAVMKPTEGVGKYAALYIRCLAFFGPASLCFQTLGGVFRGLKETRALFWGSVCVAATNVAMDLLFVYGFHWGVAGAGAATVLSTWGGFLFLLATLLSRRQLLPQHDTSLPSLPSVLKLLRKGIPLSLSSMVTLGMVFYASLSVSRLSVTSYAAFEITRLVFLVAFQLAYKPLEFTAQTLCASYLGKGDVHNARNVYQRILQLAIMLSMVVGVICLANTSRIGRLFTNDVAVVAEFYKPALLVFAFLPLDSMASIADGALVAAQESDLVGYANIASALLGLGVLAATVNTGGLTLLKSWLCIKLAFMGRLVFTAHKLYFSRSDPYAVEEEGCGLEGEAGS